MSTKSFAVLFIVLCAFQACVESRSYSTGVEKSPKDIYNTILVILGKFMEDRISEEKDRITNTWNNTLQLTEKLKEEANQMFQGVIENIKENIQLIIDETTANGTDNTECTVGLEDNLSALLNVAQNDLHACFDVEVMNASEVLSALKDEYPDLEKKVQVLVERLNNCYGLECFLSTVIEEFTVVLSILMELQEISNTNNSIIESVQYEEINCLTKYYEKLQDDALLVQESVENCIQSNVRVHFLPKVLLNKL